jgi:hypothetical protein
VKATVSERCLICGHGESRMDLVQGALLRGLRTEGQSEEAERAGHTSSIICEVTRGFKVLNVFRSRARKRLATTSHCHLVTEKDIQETDRQTQTCWENTGTGRGPRRSCPVSRSQRSCRDSMGAAGDKEPGCDLLAPRACDTP